MDDRFAETRDQQAREAEKKRREEADARARLAEMKQKATQAITSAGLGRTELGGAGGVAELIAGLMYDNAGPGERSPYVCAVFVQS